MSGTATRLACALLSAALGCANAGFACADDAQCGPDGACEPEGWCSFPDDACESGRRFGAHAGGGLAERCVPMRGDTTGGTAIAGTTSASASGGTAPGSSGSSSVAQRDSETTGVDTSTGGPSTTGEPLDPTLLVWLSFDDRADPFADGSGNALHAECDPDTCPVAEDGPRALAMRFDGIDDHLRLPWSAELVTDEALTLALWIEIDAVATGLYQDVLARALGIETDNSWAIGFPNNYAGMRTVMNDGTTQHVVAQVEWIPKSGWHHVAMTWDGALARTWVDGLVVGEVAVATIAFDDYEVLLGADINLRMLGNFFGGALDDVRIYRRALDEPEIAGLAAR